MDHLVIKNESVADGQPMWICYESYFEVWWKGQRGRGGNNEKGWRGWYLYRHYRNMRNDILLEWEKIFWRPSHTVTSNFLHGTEPSLRCARLVCPSMFRNMTVTKDWIECFGISGKKWNETPGVSTRNVHLDVCWKDGEVRQLWNPFNYFVEYTFKGFAKVVQEIHGLLIDEEFCNSDIPFPSTPLPAHPLTVDALLKIGDLQLVLDIFCGYIRILKSINNIKTVDLEGVYKDLRRSLESTEMHAFLAAWTLWSRPEQPYIVNFLLRSLDLKLFHMILSEEFLGTFYMVRPTFTLLLFAFCSTLFAV